MKKTIIVILLMMVANILAAQGMQVTFTSVTDAKFFVYLNGKLQNERSTGMITLNNLENKEYHVRIVIDDPFEVASTINMRPDPKGSEYSVRFNAVRERVYIKKMDRRRERNDYSDNPSWSQQGESGSTTPEKPATNSHKPLRRTGIDDSTTQSIINRVRF